MKKSNTILDERQEQKLLHIEHNSFWLAIVGLLVVTYAQLAVGRSGSAEVGGEGLVLALVSLYFVVSSIRNGIWDRKLKPNRKTNLLVSIGTGLLVGGFWGIRSYVVYHSASGSIATFVIMFLSLTVLVYVLLAISCLFYRHRVRQLERQAEQDEGEK